MKNLLLGIVVGICLGAAIDLFAVPEVYRDPDGGLKAQLISAAQLADIKAFLSDARVDQVTTIADWKAYQKTFLKIYRKHAKLTLSQLDTE